MEDKNFDVHTVEYDPKAHAGLLRVAGRDYIIADASQAKLDQAPIDIRKALAEQTKIEIALLDFATKEGRAIIEFINPVETAVRMEGLKKGLALLKLDPEDLRQ